MISLIYVFSRFDQIISFVFTFNRLETAIIYELAKNSAF